LRIASAENGESQIANRGVLAAGRLLPFTIHHSRFTESMTKTRFVIANLFRKKTRTILTLLSVIMAFLLFGLLQSVNVLFNAGADFIGATRLMTQARVSFTSPLPMRLLPQIEAVPGVKRVNWIQWFGGVVGENTPIVAFATDPERLHDTYPEWVMADAQWKAFADTRTGMIAGKKLAEQYGWKIGQKVPMKSNIFPQKDGSKSWTFDLVGIYDGKDEEWKKRTQQAYINFAYFNEANQFGQGRAGIFSVLLANPDQAQQVAEAIDAKFENSPDETKTQTEKDFNIGFVKQIGDIGLIVRWILFAVFFTLLLVVGNTMAQSVRERVPELAILKTLGFSDASVLGFVLAEAVAICLIGGAIGLGLATLLGTVVASSGQFPISVDYRVWSMGLVAVVVLALAVGLLPALRAQRLKIVDALAGR
jgi:putative ABC transport system permease protein